MTTAPRNIVELWALRLNPSDLSNIERPIGEGPVGGGGQLYIQIKTTMIPSLLKFLGAAYPSDGPLSVTVRNIGSDGSSDVVEFHAKSQGRMRIANQNRHRANRVRAWSPQMGFPTLPARATTTDAAEAIASLGGLHIFLAKDTEGTIWAGYTTGVVDDQDGTLPFAHLVSGQHEGGHWKYEPALGEDAPGTP